MAMTWPRSISPTMWQAGFLFTVDMVTNVTDYGFHIYVGQALQPGEFAIVQTMNAALLIVVTTFGVMQPVVARYVAEAATGTGEAGRDRAVFQLYFRHSTLIGLALTVLVWVGRRPLATWLNVPVAAVAVSAIILLLALVRPVVAGMLQGRQRFVAFGLTRTAHAVGRLIVAVALIGLLGAGALGGVAALPSGAALALLAGLLWLGRSAWRRGPTLPSGLVWEGWRLSLAALLAYAAYMGLLNMDLIWVNRTFSADLAGSYATAAVLRRVLSVLPGAVLVILYPRVVARVTKGQLPDRLLLKTAMAIVGTTTVLTAVYFILGPFLVRLTFGSGYPHAAPLLGWMGVAMIGYGVTAIWLNLYLATRPWPFVLLLIATAVTQAALLAAAQQTLLQVTAVFNVGGWLPAGGGLLLYLLWLRPRLRVSQKNQLIIREVSSDDKINE